MMAFRLNKEQARQKEELISRLREGEQALEAIRATYNETIKEASQWAETIAIRFQMEFNDKTERWQEGKTGEAISNWLEEWATFEPEPMEPPESIADALEGLPNQPE